MKSVNKPLTHRQRQALATRKLIVETARALFLAHGYTATTIESISAEAGVAVSTVYAIYKNKRGILKAIRDAWHDESGQRAIYAQALGEDDAQRRMALAAKATRRQWETGAEMTAIYTSAAAADTEAAAELQQALSGRREAIRRFIEASAAMLKSDLTVDSATTIYLALTRSEVYAEMVQVGGWSAGAYEDWLVQTLQQQLLP